MVPLRDQTFDTARWVFAALSGLRFFSPDSSAVVSRRAVTRRLCAADGTDSNATTLRLSLTFKVRRIYPTNWVRQGEKTIGGATEADTQSASVNRRRQRSLDGRPERRCLRRDSPRSTT